MSDEAPLTIEQHRAVRAALPVVERCALQVAREWRGSVEIDDLRSVGKLALYNAVRRFDAALGVPFEAYASRRVYGEMLNAVKSETSDAAIKRAARRAASRYLEYYNDDFDVLRHDDAELQRRADQLKDRVLTVAFTAGIEQALRRDAEDRMTDRAEYARALALLAAAVRALPPDDRQIIALVFRDGLDLHDVAAALGGRQKTTAWRRVQRALKGLRERLLAGGVERAPSSEDVELSGGRLADWLSP